MFPSCVQKHEQTTPLLAMIAPSAVQSSTQTFINNASLSTDTSTMPDTNQLIG